jgi:hypothetical protein
MDRIGLRLERSAAQVLVKNTLLSAVLTALSLAAGAGALILAEFGAPAWMLVLLLGWLITVGLPTLLGVLVLAGLWQGPSFRVFVLVSILSSLLLQTLAVIAFRRAAAGWRRRERPRP